MRPGLKIRNIKVVLKAFKNGKLVDVREAENLITNAGLYHLLDLLIDDADGGIRYCAIGTDDTPPSIEDTKLKNEVARKQITTRSRTGNRILLSTFFTASESAYNIKEVGLFGGSGASGDPDTGILFDRSLLSYDNSQGENDLTIDFEFEAEEVV